MDDIEINKTITIGGNPKMLRVTARAHSKLTESDIYLALTFHNMGDWGQDYENDYEYYKTAQPENVEFFSTHRDSNNQLFWVISTNDNSITVLLPTDYDPTWGDSQED